MKIKDYVKYGCLTAVLAVLVMGFIFYKSKTQEGIMGVNLPDRCTMFTQIASRSVKDRVKIYPGKVFGFTVTSSLSQQVYFQLYDQVNLPIHEAGLATPSFSIPIPAGSSTVPVLVDYTFPVPFAVTASGITFAISDRFASYGSSSDIIWKNVEVNVCYQ